MIEVSPSHGCFLFSSLSMRAIQSTWAALSSAGCTNPADCLPLTWRLPCFPPETSRAVCGHMHVLSLLSLRCGAVLVSPCRGRCMLRAVISHTKHIQHLFSLLISVHTVLFHITMD